jgi:hypothetical protein
MPASFPPFPLPPGIASWRTAARRFAEAALAALDDPDVLGLACTLSAVPAMPTAERPEVLFRLTPGPSAVSYDDILALLDEDGWNVYCTGAGIHAYAEIPFSAPRAYPVILVALSLWAPYPPDVAALLRSCGLLQEHASTSHYTALACNGSAS